MSAATGAGGLGAAESQKSRPPYPQNEGAGRTRGESFTDWYQFSRGMTTHSVTFSHGGSKVTRAPRVCACGGTVASHVSKGVRYFHPRCTPCKRVAAGGSRGGASYRRHLKPTCEACGYAPVSADELEVDHVLPVSSGGSNRSANLQTLCAVCHKKKSILDADPHHESYFTILESAPGIRLAEAIHP